MGLYYLYRANGLLVQTGHCPDGMEADQARDGLLLGCGEPPEHIKYPEPPKPTYRQERAQAYPAIGQQLDMLWHAMGRGELQMVPEWYDMVASVKQRHPKVTE